MISILKVKQQCAFITTEQQLIDLYKNHSLYDNCIIFVDANLQKDGRKKSTAALLYLIQEARLRNVKQLCC